LKHFKNGSIGNLYAGSVFNGAIIVEANQTYVEFDDGSGNRKFISWNEFGGFDYSSDGSPLTEKVVTGATIKQGATTVGTIVAVRDGYLEYEDTSGNFHVSSTWNAFDLP
jgi:hypothetical protein